MRLFATLKNFTSSKSKDVIVRNLNRILEIVILDLDIENGTITFLYDSKTALDKVKRELNSIGYPIICHQVQDYKKRNSDVTGKLV